MSRVRLLASLLALCLACPLASSHPALDVQEAHVRALIAQAPGDARLRLQLAGVLEEHGRLDAARDALSAALALDDELVAAHLAAARVELRAGRPAASLAAAERFLAVEPEHAGGLLARARALAALHDERSAGAWARALDALEAAGRPQPEIYVAAADALGVAAIDRAIARLGAAPTLLARGIAMERGAGRIDEALSRCADAARRAPSPEWSVVEGEILADAGRREEAHAAFLRARDQVAALPARARASRFVADLQARAIRGMAP